MSAHPRYGAATREKASIVPALERATHLVGARLNAKLADIGLSHAGAHVLLMLARHGPLTVAEVQKLLGTPASTVTSILDRLEADGMLRRERNARDLRSYTLHLTPIGERGAARIAAAIRRWERAVEAHVSRRDLEGFAAVLSALHEVLRAERS